MGFRPQPNLLFLREKTIIMKNLVTDFSALQTYTYLNTPATGLISKSVKEFRQNHYEDLWQMGSNYFDANALLYAQTRECIAQHFGGNPERVALVPAFSFGWNAILEGLPQSSRVLLLQGDYPSINRAVAARGFQIDYAKIDENLEEHIYNAFLANQPDVFAFSIVQYLNGIKIDLDFIKKLKHEFPDTLLIGDGTQYLGMERFNFKASGLDVLGASAYKWIGAGFGNGFFMFAQGVEERIAPKHLGFGSGIGKYKSGDTLIGKFEGSHLDAASMGSVKVALEQQQIIGVEQIEKQVSQLAEKAKKRLSDLGLLEPAVIKRSQHSSIFNIRGDEQVYDWLIAKKIVCSLRGNGIRIGFHYYNTEQDLDKLCKCLKS